MTPSNFEVLACEPTPLGLLCLRRRRLLSRPDTVVTEVTLDHEFLMSSHVTESERALARCALDIHSGKDLRILVGGLGLGYTAHAALASDRVARVEVIEYLPQVIDWLHRDLVPLAAALKADPRLAVSQGDVYERLASVPTHTYDLILIDVDHAPDQNLGVANKPFYTEEGLRLAQRHLSEGGILGVWSYEEHSPFTEALSRVFREVRVSPVRVMNDLVNTEQTDWLFFALR